MYLSDGKGDLSQSCLENPLTLCHDYCLLETCNLLDKTIVNHNTETKFHKETRYLIAKVILYMYYYELYVQKSVLQAGLLTATKSKSYYDIRKALKTECKTKKMFWFGSKGSCTSP